MQFGHCFNGFKYIDKTWSGFDTCKCLGQQGPVYNFYKATNSSQVQVYLQKDSNRGKSSIPRHYGTGQEINKWTQDSMIRGFRFLDTLFKN
jgi:hypothetical protein